MVYAIEHGLGLSLFEARTAEAALRRARKCYGEYASPYILPDNQAEQVTMAKEFGADVQ